MILGLLNTLRFPMNLLATSFAATQDCLVAAKRISAFLLREESRRQSQRPAKGTDSEGADHAASANEVVCCWDPALSFRLRVPSCGLARGSRVAILGPVGSGKTSFLSMLLGEMHSLQGAPDHQHIEPERRKGDHGESMGNPWHESQHLFRVARFAHGVQTYPLSHTFHAPKVGRGSVDGIGALTSTSQSLRVSLVNPTLLEGKGWAVVKIGVPFFGGGGGGGL